MAKKKEYQIDDNLQVSKAGRQVGRFFRSTLEVVLLSIGITCVIYAVFSLLVNTDTEARLKRENKMYSKVYPELVTGSELLENAVKMLEVKDNEIYGEVFNAQAPSVNPIGSLSSVHASDSVPDESLVKYTYSKAAMLSARASEVEDNFVKILLQVSRPDIVLPPMRMPLRGVSYTQVGASVGSKINPVYNARVDHKGVDFIVHQGKPVIAPKAGVVAAVENSTKGQGNVVELRHEGGFVTRYAHLASIAVSVGQKVAAGQKIGNVGSSGNTSSPHLHYELKLGKAYLDPLGCMFAGVDPETYANYLYMGSKTEKSLD